MTFFHSELTHNDLSTAIHTIYKINKELKLKIFLKLSLPVDHHLKSTCKDNDVGVCSVLRARTVSSMDSGSVVCMYVFMYGFKGLKVNF